MRPQSAFDLGLIVTRKEIRYGLSIETGIDLGFFKGSEEVVAHPNHPVYAFVERADRDDSRLRRRAVYLHFVLDFVLVR